MNNKLLLKLKPKVKFFYSRLWDQLDPDETILLINYYKKSVTITKRGNYIKTGIPNWNYPDCKISYERAVQILEKNNISIEKISLESIKKIIKKYYEPTS